MRTFEENMGRIAQSMGRAAGQVGRPSALFIGIVTEAGRGRLRVNCCGLQLEPEDLWLAPGFDYKWTEDTGGNGLLRKDDRVILLSEDGQDYYLISKAVRA